MSLLPIRKPRPLQLVALTIAALALCAAALVVILRAPPAFAQPPMVHGGMAMKPVVCRPVDAAAGLFGQKLASAVEQQALEMHSHNYGLVGLLPGESKPATAPVACYRSLTDPSTLPMGAR